MWQSMSTMEGVNLKANRDTWWHTSAFVTTCAPAVTAALAIALDIEPIPPSAYLHGTHFEWIA